MSLLRWFFRSTEYELDGFDWLHGRDAAAGSPQPLWSRESLVAVAIILVTPLVLLGLWLVGAL